MTRVVIHKDLVARLICAAITTLPNKAYGIISGTDLYHPTNLYQCYTNLRNSDPYWKTRIDSFGRFYENPERGFVIAPEELLPIYEEIDKRNEIIIGVFHSHRCCVPGEPTKIDRSLHLQCQPKTLAYIILVENAAIPSLRIYDILNEKKHKELTIKVIY